jgi:hypothetical protein
MPGCDTRVLGMADVRSMPVAGVHVSTVTVAGMQVSTMPVTSVRSACVRYAAERHGAKSDNSNTEAQHVDVHHWATSRPSILYGLFVPGIWIIGIALPLTIGILPSHFLAISYCTSEPVMLCDSRRFAFAWASASVRIADARP